MAGSFNGHDAPSFSTLTEQDFLARAVAAQDQLRQQNPDLSEAELDLKLSTGWWKTAFLLPAVIEESVSKDINDELQAACREFAAANYSREALDKFATKARALLANHEEALQLIETNILKTPEVWNRMHEHIMSKQNNKPANA